MIRPLRSARVITLASGKGGVGKTSVAVNLGIALSRLGRRTMLVDCDFGMANAAIMMGMNPATTLEDFFAGNSDLESIVTMGPSDLIVVPGGTARETIRHPDETLRRRLSSGLREYSDRLDYIIVDTPSGIARDTLSLIAESDTVVLIVSAEPTAFTDAYATLKTLILDYDCKDIAVVANMVDDGAAAHDLFSRLSVLVSRFLPVDLRFLGYIVNDKHLRDAVMCKRSCIEAFPSSQAANCLNHLALALDAIPITRRKSGDIFFAREELHACY
jgi:flagellar biosynthesis protein FlhG